MSQTDIPEIAKAAAGITIDGPPQHVHNPRPTTIPVKTATPEDEPGPQPEGPDTEDAATVANAAPAGGLFDTSVYLDVPTVDGQTTDALTIGFGGTIKFDASDEEGKRLFEALTLGREVELRIAAVVATKKGAWKRNAKDEEVVTGGVGLRVESLYVLRPEDL